MSDFESWVADCHLQKIEGEGEFRCQAAVWADSHATFRTHLDAHLLSGGFKVLWLEECLSAPQYIARHGEQQKVGVLARVVHSQHLVEISQMMALEDGEPKAPESYLIVEEIDGVEPLDAQLGAWPMKNVPDTLMAPMFSEVDPSKAEVEHYGGLENVPPMKTYAILDASKIQFGLSVIEECEMPFRCLFKGAAAEDFMNVAPYLIELDPEKRFTRTLFTYNPNMPDNMSTVHLWHKEPGIYIRSRADFGVVWKHFRKFTRVQDESGKWYYFRFWEAKVASGYFDLVAVSAQTTLQWWGGDATGFQILVPNHISGKLCIFRRNYQAEITEMRQLFILSSEERQHLIGAKQKEFHERLATYLGGKVTKFLEITYDRQIAIVKGLIQNAQKHGIDLEQAVVNYAEAAIRLEKHPEGIPNFAAILDNKVLSQVTRTENILSEVKRS